MKLTHDTRNRELMKLAARHAKYKVNWCNGYPDVWNPEQGIYEQWRPLYCNDQSEDLRRKLRIEIFVTRDAVVGRRLVQGELLGVMSQFIDRNSDIDEVKRWIILVLASLKPEAGVKP